jgi:hypothetical protein
MKHKNDACLHCRVWSTIRQFCKEYPDGCVEDVIDALADVVGDQLAGDGSYPLRENFLKAFDDRVQTRIKAGRDIKETGR